VPPPLAGPLPLPPGHVEQIIPVAAEVESISQEKKMQRSTSIVEDDEVDK
jgi:hypothetical protein